MTYNDNQILRYLYGLDENRDYPYMVSVLVLLKWTRTL